MNNIEEIYDQALKMMKKGHSLEDVLVQFNEHKDALSPLLSLSASLLNVPKNIVPTPLMKRKYAMAAEKTFRFAWLHMPKFAGVSMSLLFLIGAFSFMGYQTANSAPGQMFFPVKKSAEKLQVILAFDEDAKATVQIAIAQKRIEEAKGIFENPNSGVEEKKAALAEMANQTSTAVAQVNTAAKNDLNSEKNHPLIDSLDSITQQQESLLAKISPDNQIESETHTALNSLNESSAKISEIKESVAIAGADAALTKLTEDPNSIAVLGQISQISENRITVENTTFVINFQTIVRDSSGNGLAFSQLQPKAKVNVVGVKSSNTVMARQITLIKPQEIKPETPTQPTQNLPKTATGSEGYLKEEIAEPKADQKNEMISAPIILEDPAPQFAR